MCLLQKSECMKVCSRAVLADSCPPNTKFPSPQTTTEIRFLGILPVIPCTHLSKCSYYAHEQGHLPEETAGKLRDRV